MLFTLKKSEEAKLYELVDVFLQENAKLNLSAFRTAEHCWIGNILDSIALLDVLPKLFSDDRKLSFIDIGTGGGFPLLPLAITLPQHTFTGLDATQKKIDAIKRIADALKLENVDLICERAEKLGRDPKHREQYDVATLRAVADANVLLEYASPLVKVGGFVIFWKSMIIDDEMKNSLLARAELSCHLKFQHTYQLPGNFGERQILVFEKTARTHDKYPRDVGVPKKNPLQ